jgi:hypothetical protein
MATYNTLGWQNENGLSSYPFLRDIEPRDFIVDAKFVQFDNYTPTLNSIAVEDIRIDLVFTFDYGEGQVSFYREAYELGDEYRSVRIYNKNRTRYMGSVTFGPGAATLWDMYAGRYIEFNTPFLACVTRSIPSQDAVYLLDGSYGDLNLSRASDDTTIFYNVSKKSLSNPGGLNSITFNAVAGHAAPQGANRPNGLKQINLVKPIKNNINLASNDVIKVSPVYGAGLSMDLVSGTISSSFSVPSLTS